MATKTKTKRKTKVERVAELMAIAWHALKSVANKEASKAARNRLVAGASHQVELELSGTIDGKACHEEISGTLTVGHDSDFNSSSDPDYVGVVALLLWELGGKRRLEIRANWPEYFTRTKQLPPVAQELRDEAADLLEAIRARKSTTRRGAVSFAHQEKPEPETAKI